MGISLYQADTVRDAKARAASERRRDGFGWDGVLGCLVFLVCFSYLLFFRHFSSIEPDEGIILQGATRILAGQVPYRDFFTFYTPGSFYALAGLFAMFGNSLAVARMSIAVVGGLCSVLTYLLARRVCAVGVSILVALLATVAGTAFRFLVLHNYYSTLLACVAVYALIRVLETSSTGWAFVTGSLVGLTFMVEQSKGGGLGMGVVLTLVLLQIRGSALPHRAVVHVAAGMAWPVLFTWAYFSFRHAGTTMIENWLWPLHHYTTANHVPYGWQNWSEKSRQAIFGTGPLFIRVVKGIAVSPGIVIAVLPMLAVALLLYWTSQLRKGAKNGVYYVAVCSSLTGLLVSVLITRPDVLHFMYLAPLWYVILAWILGAPAPPGSLLLKARPLLIAYAAAAFGMLGFAVLLATTGTHRELQTRRGPITTSEQDTVIPYVQAHTYPGSPLLVYPYLPLYNYLTATTNPSRYDFFQPGMNTPGQAAEIMESLSRDNSPVLIEPSFAEKFANSWPETPLSAVVNDPVIDYVVRNFRVCALLQSPEGWRFEYMVRKDARCPEQQ